MDRQRGDFDVCCSPGTSATQHFSSNDLAFFRLENECFQALGQMGTKKAKMVMEEVNENKDGVSEST